MNLLRTVIGLSDILTLFGCEKKSAETKSKGKNELILVTSHQASPPHRAIGTSTCDGATEIDLPRGGNTTAADQIASDATGVGGRRMKILQLIFEGDAPFDKIVTPNFHSTILVPHEEMPENLKVTRLRPGIDLGHHN